MTNEYNCSGCGSHYIGFPFESFEVLIEEHKSCQQIKEVRSLGFGKQSARSYSVEEFRAAVRLGLATKNGSNPTGSIFWATGNYYPEKLLQLEIDAREVIADVAILKAAFDREWSKKGEANE